MSTNKKTLFISLAFLIFGIALSGANYLYKYPSILAGGVRKLGPLKLGDEVPIGPGDYTFYPPPKIPPSRFYISVVQPHPFWCVFEECSPEGAIVEKLGGWLQGENTSQPLMRQDFGFNYDRSLKSIIVVGNQDAQIVGIYPNWDINDLSDILRIHSKLVYGDSGWQKRP